MQISDLIGQYGRNVANKTEELKGVSGMQKVVSTLDELSAGSVFEGTVSFAKNGKVTLMLSNGQSITARLSGKVALSQGTPMFFQVKSNDGVTLEIKPYMGAGNSGNPILTNALTEAGVLVTERNLAMVDAMMKEQMPIDKQSVANMVRTANMNPKAAIQTLVQMVKLGIPVSDEMAAQFENYQTDKNAVLQEMGQAAEQISNIFKEGQMSPGQSIFLNQKLMDILLPENVGLPENGKLPETAALSENGETSPKTLGHLLSGEQIKNLSRAIQNLPALAKNQTLFPGIAEEDIFVDTLEDDMAAQSPAAGENVFDPAGKTVLLDKNMDVREFLRTLAAVLSKNEEPGAAGLHKLLGSEEYKTLLRDAAEQQWFLKPGELKEKNKLNELYTRLAHQMKQMEDVLQQAGLAKTAFHDTASAIRSNIEFMNQMNQVYTYVQIPLKMSGQNATGELYVYTNKKKLMEPDAEVSAFLHLDLEHLGSTDVSVKMKRKKADANFYMSDDASYALVEKYIPVLERKLKDRGYACTITMKKEEKKVNFNEDFLRRDMPSPGILHRYSFDMRA